MIKTVTFDSNTLGLACRPEKATAVREALLAGRISGFFSVTMLTLEGIPSAERGAVYAGTTISSQERCDSPNDVRVEFRVEQPDRKPIPEAAAQRIRHAREIGIRALRPVPRIGAFRIDDPDGTFYLSNGDGPALDCWINKCHEVARAIEGRGVGSAQVKALGRMMAGNNTKHWFEALGNPKDIHQKNEVIRTFAEWADGDAIASHVAYDLDVFCTEDRGRSNPKGSVLDDQNRTWLASTYGVCFMTFDELTSVLGAEGEAA